MVFYYLIGTLIIEGLQIFYLGWIACFILLYFCSNIATYTDFMALWFLQAVKSNLYVMRNFIISSQYRKIGKRPFIWLWSTEKAYDGPFLLLTTSLKNSLLRNKLNELSKSALGKEFLLIMANKGAVRVQPGIHVERWQQIIFKSIILSNKLQKHLLLKIASLTY